MIGRYAILTRTTLRGAAKRSRGLALSTAPGAGRNDGRWHASGCRESPVQFFPKTDIRPDLSRPKQPRPVSLMLQAHEYTRSRGDVLDRI